MKIEVSETLQKVLDRMGLKAPNCYQEAERINGLIDLVLDTSRKLTDVEVQLLSIAGAEIERMANVMLAKEMRDFEEKELLNASF